MPRTQRQRLPLTFRQFALREWRSEDSFADLDVAYHMRNQMRGFFPSRRFMVTAYDRVDGYFIVTDSDPYRKDDIPRQRQCKCKVCKCTYSRVVYLSEALRSDRSDYVEQMSHLCPTCRRTKEYSYKQFPVKYPSSAGAVTFGFELEMVNDVGDEARIRYHRLIDRLIQAGFARTGDSTVDDEMKAPIYHLSYIPGNLKKLLTAASEFTRSDSVGTHLHIGLTNRHHFLRLRNQAPYVFAELENYLAKHLEHTEKVWGRVFTGYANFPMNNSHGSWVSLHPDTIEWRLPRLASYAQYAKLVKWLTMTCEQVGRKLHEGGHASQLAEEVLMSYHDTFGEGTHSNSIMDAFDGFTHRDISYWMSDHPPINGDWYDRLDVSPDGSDEYDSDDDSDDWDDDDDHDDDDDD